MAAAKSCLTDGGPDWMAFRFTLGDAPVQVDGIAVSAVG